MIKAAAVAPRNKWQKAILEDGFGGPEIAVLFHLDRAPDVLLTVTKGSDWINVYAHRRRKGEKTATASGGIGNNGWNVVEKRWSYGVGPNGAGELRNYLKRIEGFPSDGF